MLVISTHYRTELKQASIKPIYKDLKGFVRCMHDQLNIYFGKILSMIRYSQKALTD